MIRQRMFHLAGAAIVLLGLGPLHRGQAASPSGEIYEDSARGFTIQPPSGKLRRTAGMITWFQEDARTGAETWSFSIAQQPCPKGLAMKDYSRDVLARIRAKGAYQVSSARLGTLAGRDVMDVRGIIVKPIRLWQRQVWVSTGDETVLVFLMTGPTAMEKQLTATSDAALATLKVTGAQVAQAEAEAAAERGKALLAAVDDRKLSAAVRPGPQWFLMYSGDRPVGYFYAQEAATRRGVSIATVASAVGGGRVRTTGRHMLTAADGKNEQWQETLFDQKGNVTETLQGRRRGDSIVHQGTRGGKATGQTTAIDPARYLPQAMGWLVARLVDLKHPAAYAFMWDPGRGPLVWRRVTVERPEALMGASGDTASVRLTDCVESGNGGQSSTLWVADDGRLLRMQSGDGVDLRAASPEMVTQAFPAAPATVKTVLQKMSVSPQ